MGNQIEDILKKLMAEKDRLTADINRIGNAIEALSGEDYESKQESRATPERTRIKPKGKTTIIRRRLPTRGLVGWASEIDAIFLENDRLKPSEVIAKLIENGVPGLDNIDTKKSVYATLNRKVNDDKLYKNESGEYCKK